MVAVNVDAEPRWVAAAVLWVAVLAPECVVVLVESPAVRVHAREHDDVQMLDDRADGRGAERLPAVNEPCPVRIRLEQVGGEVDADLRAAPFARVSAGGEQDPVSGGVAADPQRVARPAFDALVRQRDQLGDAGVGGRQALQRGVDLIDVQVAQRRSRLRRRPGAGDLAAEPTWRDLAAFEAIARPDLGLLRPLVDLQLEALGPQRLETLLRSDHRHREAAVRVTDDRRLAPEVEPFGQETAEPFLVADADDSVQPTWQPRRFDQPDSSMPTMAGVCQPVGHHYRALVSRWAPGAHSGRSDDPSPCCPRYDRQTTRPRARRWRYSRLRRLVIGSPGG